MPHKLLQVQEEYQKDFQSSVRFTAVAYLLHQSLSASLQAYHYDFRHLLTGAIIMTLRQPHLDTSIWSIAQTQRLLRLWIFRLRRKSTDLTQIGNSSK